MSKKDLLKKYLLSLGLKSLNLLKSISSVSIRILNILLFAACLLYVSAKAPETHGQILRHYVGSRVYMIRDSLNSGGGTGFAIEAPSGESYIITNDHVCEVSSDKVNVLVTDDEGLHIKRRIIARSEYSDLCLIEGIPGVEGLSVGSEPSVGQIVAAVGHPSLMPITLTRGEIIGATDVVIQVGPIAILDPKTNKMELVPPLEGGINPKDCMKPKNRQLQGHIQIFIFMIPGVMCVNVTEGAYLTNMQIQPGSSGSPVVDFFGRVVGVVFAGDRLMWASVVSHKDLVNFLKPY